MIDNAYQLVFNTGVFAADCWEWNKRAIDDKTLPHIKLLALQNETGAPYRAAHNATANPDNMYLHQDMVDAIAELVTSTESEGKEIAQFTATDAIIIMELATMNEKLAIDFQGKRASRRSTH